MTRILTRPKLKFEYAKEHEKFYSLKKPLLYRYKSELSVINPSDNNGVFMFNLASVPWYLKWLHKPNSKQTLYPSIVHDYKYSDRTTKRLQDDIIFRELTKSEQKYYLSKVKRFERFKLSARYFITRWTIYFLLRIFGSANKV